MPLILDGTEGITQPTITTAFGLPAGTTAQRPASPEAGMVRFNTDTGLLETYTGTEWSAGVDVEQAITDFAAGEPGQPRLVGNAVSVFPGTYPALTVTASDAHSVANGIITTGSGASFSTSSFVATVQHVIEKYNGTIRFRVSTQRLGGGTTNSNYELQVLKNGVQAALVTGTVTQATGGQSHTVEVSVVPTDVILWNARRTSGDMILGVFNGSNTASNGYVLRSLFAPAV